MPRLKGIRKEKLNSPGIGKPGDYPNLLSIMDKAINWQLIKEQYDEMVKCAVTIKTRTADAEAILRRFTKDNLSHPTYKAFLELGRVLKTVFLCRYLHSEELRRDQTRRNACRAWGLSSNGTKTYVKPESLTE